MNDEQGKKAPKVDPQIEKDRRTILEGQQKGFFGKLGAYTRLSGPGWLQSAITLGGGSLSSSLYLGVLVGFTFMWLQPVAMIMGVIMLSSIAYVTLSTGKRPFRAINEHISPVMGWGWLLASMLANLVWSMPQFAIGTAAIQQNLVPNLLGLSVMPDPWGRIIASVAMLIIAITFVMIYSMGSKGVKVFEVIVKSMVGIVVICFIGTVITLTVKGVLDWGEIFSGFIPNLSLVTRPADKLMPFVNAVDAQFRGFWSELIVSQQRDVMISAAATAVGINMTFLLPYSMLRKGWDKTFRGLAQFDLSTGLFIPFVLTTGCIVIAAASQFHAVPSNGFLGEVDEATGEVIKPAANLVESYDSLVSKRLEFEMGSESFAELSDAERESRLSEFKESLSEPEKKMAAMVVKRDAFNLSEALAPLTGGWSRYIFGIGLTGMALSAITMLMTINGLCLCEMFNLPLGGKAQRIGSLMVMVGVLGPFFWQDAKMWLVMPTSVFAMVLLPVAYCSFYLLMNQKKLLGDDRPKGLKRVYWNIIMAIAVLGAAFMSLYSILTRGPAMRMAGLIVIAIFVVLTIIVHFVQKKKRAQKEQLTESK